jgi:hypothetical protein
MGVHMTLTKFACICLLALAGAWGRATQSAVSKAQADDARSTIAGVWRGHSVCTDKNSACHDEVNVYRFSSVKGQPNAFFVTASKVVDGKEIVMGSGEWKYDERRKLVESEKPPIRMTIDGKKMEGALRLADGTVYRRIYLEKEN